ncbi:MAG: hypothetical protein AAFO03_00835 [Bacteroidota bacterium]
MPYLFPLLLLVFSTACGNPNSSNEVPEDAPFQVLSTVRGEPNEVGIIEAHYMIYVEDAKTVSMDHLGKILEDYFLEENEARTLYIVDDPIRKLAHDGMINASKSQLLAASRQARKIADGMVYITIAGTVVYNKDEIY